MGACLLTLAHPLQYEALQVPAVYVPLAPKGDDGPVTLLVRLLLNLGAEGNSAHDTVTELLVQDSLVGVSVVLHNLEQPVDQWLLWWHLHLPATVWPAGELVLEHLMGDLKDIGQVLDVVWRSLGLAVE